MNVRRLPAPLSASGLKRWGMVWAAVLWGWFTAEQVARATMGALSVDTAGVESLAWHPVRAVCYALWIGLTVWFAFEVVPRPRRSRVPR
jgi:hypothetical protein